MKCPKCQFENPADMQFCGKCGSRLEVVCSKCGFSNPAEFAFCGKCGHTLAKPEPESLIDYEQPHSYTPKHLADKILATRSSIEGERKLVTVLFADVANFTDLSENLDPEEVHQIMDGCFKILMEEIHKYEGTINQFTGDGVMALFGAPVAHEEHAQRACHASLSIQTALSAYGEKVKKETGKDFKMRIGLNSGPVIVGSIGDDLRMDYTAVGDTTNLASRMEGLAKPGTIMLSRNTYRLARDFFEFNPLGKVHVKGKEEPQEVFELIKAGEVVTRLGAAAAKGLTRFVGRENSMAALMEACDKARSGSGQVVGMVGEAGVGKSRLFLEFKNRLPQNKFKYFEGRCLHYGGSMPYLPVLDILRSYFEIEEGDREFVIKKKMEEKVFQLDENLKGVLAPFQGLLSLKVEDEEFANLQPKEKRERIFEALRDLMIRVSQEEFLVLAVEDLHWIDKTSEEFLNYFIGWLANSKILLFLLYRPEYTHPWGSKSYYNQIGLNQLTLKSSAELVRAILVGGEAVPELKELILNRAAGNPLFMEELTHTLLENGTIERKERKYVLNRKPSDIQVPDSIQGIITARMDRLEEDLKRVMQVASVIGRDFAFRILQAITGMREELKSHLLNLQGLEFIYEKSLFPELEYIFKHALTQEVAYNSLLAKRRREIHKRIGEAIEALYPARLEEFYEMLSYHYSKSDDFEKAYKYLKLAGEKATNDYSTWEAFRLYQEANNIINQMPKSEENKRKKLEILRLMMIPMGILGYPNGSLELLREGERLSHELGDNQVLARCYSDIGVYYSHKGDHAMGVQYSEKGFEEARKNQDFELMTNLAFELCTSYFGTGMFYKIVAVAQSVLDLLETTIMKHESQVRMVGIYPILCAYCGNSMGQLGNFEEGIVYCEKGLRVVADDDLRTLGLCELQYGYLYLAKGEGKAAIQHFEKCIEYVEGMRWAFILALAWTGAGMGHVNLADPETAIQCIERGIRVQRDAGVEWWLSLHNQYLSMAYFTRGDIKKARSCAEESIKLSQKNSEKHIEGGSRILMGKIFAETDPPKIEEAEEYILNGIKMLEELKLRPFFSIGYLYLGEVYADWGRQEKALKNLEKAESMFQQMGMEHWLGMTKTILEKVR